MDNQNINKPDLPKLDELSLDKIVSFSSDVYWGVTNPDRFRQLMNEAISLVEGGSFLGDNLFTWTRNNSALEDAAFRKSWEGNAQNNSDKTIVWRRYILACAAYHCLHLAGDFVECGVYLGSGIKTVIDYLGGTAFPKPFWGYDTFDYHPVINHAFREQKQGLYEKVKYRFKDYLQVRLIQGLLPDSFTGNKPESVAYLHIDLNNYESEIAVLDVLFEMVVPGGIIILDDYEWAGIYRPQKKAEDQWFDRRRYRVFPLPTGQGLIIKR